MGDWELLPSNSPQSFCTFLEKLFEGKKYLVRKLLSAVGMI